MTGQTYTIVLFCGVLTEALLFSKGEWDRHAPNIIKAYTIFGASTFFGLIILGYPVTIALKLNALHGIAYFVGLFGSIVAYRLLFHPLRDFAGPVPARITSWWLFRESCPDLSFYKKLRTLHDHYGDFVRIRPRELSIRHPDAVMDIHGPRSKMRKGEFYDQSLPHQSIQFTRDSALHRRKRPVWDKAFQPKSVKEYMPRLEKHYGILMGIFARHAKSSDPVNAAESFLYLGLDLISELTFGESFNLLSTGKPNLITDRIVHSKKAIGFALIITWHVHLLKAVSGSGKKMMQAYITALDKRREMVSESPDFYTYLSQSETWEADRQHEARLAIVAGSDTVATTLTNICWFLSKYPEYQSKLYDEIADLPENNGFIDDQLLAHKPMLLGVINEVLRLCPPVPSGMQRLTPPEGALIAGRYIPGDIVVTTPTWSLQRDKRAFVHPDTFIPERWSSLPDLILRKDAFIPFSAGIYNCAGKSLAMMELRMTVAMVVRRFEFSFPEGREDECRWFMEDHADCFVLDLHPLPLVLKERVKGL